MKSFTDKEYFDLCQTLINSQYDTEEDDNSVEMEWIPSEPIKKSIPLVNNHIACDLTNIKSDKLKEEILKFRNFKIGTFKIRIYNQNDGDNAKIRLTAWEERYKTLSGHPCNIDYALNFSKDSRFEKAPWLNKFNSNSASCLSINDTIEIIRWLQIAHRMVAFL